MDIEPCPFCGGDKVVIVDNTKEFDQVRCNFCGANGPTSDGHPEDCIWAWNRVARTIRLYESRVTRSTVSIDTGEEETERTDTKWIRIAESPNTPDGDDDGLG